MAMLLREINKFPAGVPYRAYWYGHPWYKCIDSAITVEDMQAIIDILWPIASKGAIPVPQLSTLLPPPIILHQEAAQQVEVPKASAEAVAQEGMPNGQK
jgi:hypothetical protein